MADELDLLRDTNITLTGVVEAFTGCLIAIVQSSEEAEVVRLALAALHRDPTARDRLTYALYHDC